MVVEPSGTVVVDDPSGTVVVDEPSGMVVVEPSGIVNEAKAPALSYDFDVVLPFWSVTDVSRPMLSYVYCTFPVGVVTCIRCPVVGSYVFWNVRPA